MSKKEINEDIKDILKNAGLNEEEDIGFTQDQVLSTKLKMDGFADRISNLKDEMQEVFEEMNEFRTDNGNFVIKGFNDYARAIQSLDKAFMNIRKGAFKGFAKMPKGGEGTFSNDLKKSKDKE